MLEDIFQQFQIDTQKRNLRSLKSDLKRTTHTNEELQDQIAKLSLVTAAVWSFVKESQHLEESDLVARIEEIDLQDGIRDGKVSAIAVMCPGCGHRINKRHKTCIYCGNQNQDYSPFTEITDRESRHR